MESADALWVARLRRDQLFDLLEGRLPDAVPVHPQETAELRPQLGEIAAVWRFPPQSGAWAMPAALVVEEEGMADLFAWAATYLRPLMPLTAQTRVLSPSRLLALTELDPLDLGPFLGGAVGLTLCEVLMHARPGMPLAAVSATAARSTLSYALARARRLGLSWHDLPEVAALFHRLRLELHQPIAETATDAIFNVTEAFLRETGSASSTHQSSRSASWFGRLLAGSDIYELAGEVLSFSGDLLAGRNIGSLGNLTAEERVRLLDEVAPLLSGGASPRLERAFALALTCFVCRPGLEQQASLLREYARQLPESWLWLGVMQCRAPLAEVLSTGDGAGWWIARELGRKEDPFSPPRADVAAAELLTMLQGRPKQAARFLARGRIEVELVPMVSVMLRGPGDRAAMGAQETLPTMDIPQPNAHRPAQQALSEARHAIETALHIIQELGGEKGVVERMTRARKKR